jgi:surface polysaccharide O-acyltransferase-like enzyme
MPGIDALRSVSMVAVVTAHAAVAYATLHIPGLPWAVHDGSRAWTYDLITWSTISVAMPAFFALGGFAAAAIWASRGPRGYLRDRMSRIVWPTLASVPAVLLPAMVVWFLGWYVSGRVALREIPIMAFGDSEIRSNRIGPAHLWFLEYLLLMLAAYGVARLASKRTPSRLPGWALGPIGPVLLAIPTALILFGGHALNGLDPIMDMRNNFIPNPVRWLHHAWFFAVGTYLFDVRADLKRLIPLCPWFLALAVPAFVVRSNLLGEDIVHTLTGPRAWALVFSGALFGWFGLFGVIGLFLRAFNRPNPMIQYVSASSYWVYLTHFPIIGLIQVALYPLPLPATAKIGLVSYQVFVRHGRIGRWLNGNKPVVATTAVAAAAA